MKKNLLILILSFSVSVLYAQKSDSESGSTTSAAASGAVQMENDGFRKYGTNPLSIYMPGAFMTSPMYAFLNNSIINTTNSDGEVFGYGVNASGQLEFVGNGSTMYGSFNTKLVIDDETGNVGIGTLSPLSKTDVSGDLTLSKSGLGFGSRKLQFYSDQGTGSEWRPGYISSGDNSDFTGRLDFYTNGTGSANKLGSVMGMSVANGKVGIGTTTPGFDLHIDKLTSSVNSTTGILGIGPSNSTHLILDRNQINSWNNTSSTNFFINYYSKGTVIIGSGSEGDLDVKGYTQLGDTSPNIKMKKFSGTTDADASTDITHSLTASKIISVNASIFASPWYYSPGSSFTAAFNYNLNWNSTIVQLGTVGSSLQSKAYTVTVIYEE